MAVGDHEHPSVGYAAIMTDRPIPPTIVYEPRINARDTSQEDLAALREAAEGGDRYAQGRLAYVLRDASRENIPEAEGWLRRAAEAGDAQAQALLGEWLRWGAHEYVDGETRTDDAKFAESTAWVHKAAEQGYPGAEYDLGMAYFHGWPGARVDLDEARWWFARAAAHGHPQAAEHGRKLTDPTIAERFVGLLQAGADALYEKLDDKIRDWAEGEDRRK